MATVTLPDELRDTLERGARAEGVSSVEEYVQLLAERDREADSPFGEVPDEGAEKLRARLVALVHEGLDSGPAEVVGPDFWESLRRNASGSRSAVPRGESGLRGSRVDLLGFVSPPRQQGANPTSGSPLAGAAG